MIRLLDFLNFEVFDLNLFDIFLLIVFFSNVYLVSDLNIIYDFIILYNVIFIRLK